VIGDDGKRCCQQFATDLRVELDAFVDVLVGPVSFSNTINAPMRGLSARRRGTSSSANSMFTGEAMLNGFCANGQGAPDFLLEQNDNDQDQTSQERGQQPVKRVQAE
jgi:hypothetical protein